jgi:LacI family transcriptional regulator
MAMIASALRMADTHDMALLIAETGTDAKRAKRATQALLDRQIDGLIVAEMGAKQVDLPDVPTGLPVIFANALGPSGTVSILPDESGGATDVVNELLSGKYRSSILIIGGHPVLETDLRRSATIGTRMRAIREALVAGGVSTWSEEKSMAWNPDLGYQTIKRLAAEEKMPDAVIALNDNIALGVYSACNELGIVIGKDISVVSFDDDELISHLRPGLTTSRLPYAEIGEVAVKGLVEKPLEPGVHLIPMPLQVRASVAKG